MMASATINSRDSANIRAAAAQAAFGKPLVVNVWRGLIAETIVASALGPEWTWCSEDYSGWDFRRVDGLLLEVKQSAARQSWTRPGAKPSPASFDIAQRQGRLDGPTYIGRRCRWANIYVFAHHDVFDAGADHCDPAQWTFYTVPTEKLPDQQTIRINALRRLSVGSAFAGLADAVRRAGEGASQDQAAD